VSQQLVLEKHCNGATDMFEYLPFYDEKVTDEEAKNILIKFVNTVYDIGDKYDIDLSNAFSVILGCCEKNEALLPGFP
jgi:ribosomal protein S25